MQQQVSEPQQKYGEGIIERGVKTAIAEELERRRKLGLPIVFGKDGKIVTMISNKVVDEREYEKKTSAQ